MSDLMMNVHTCVTVNTTYTMLCVMYCCDHCLHQGICKIIMSYLLMNEHTCVTDTTTYTMLCQITMSDSMMNVDPYFTDNTTYAMLYVRYLCQI
jgi:hypothetical protein